MLPGGVDFTQKKVHAAFLAPTHIVAMPGLTHKQQTCTLDATVSG